MDIKQRIIESSVLLFKEKGYSRTSVEDIVRKCRISKASLYKVFDSKKEILLHALNLQHEELHRKNDELDLGNLTADKKLIRKIAMFLSHFHFNHELFASVPEAFSEEELDEMKQYAKPYKLEIYRMHKKNFRHAFGADLDDRSLWSMAVTYEGLVKEWLEIIHIFGTDDIDFVHIARYIAAAMKIIIKDHHQSLHLLPSLIDRLILEENKMFHKKENTLSEKLHRMEEIILNAPIDESERDNYLSNIAFLQQEFSMSRPREYLVDSVLYYLSQLEEVEPIVKSIQFTYKETERNS